MKKYRLYIPIWKTIYQTKEHTQTTKGGKAGFKRDWLGRKTDKRRSPKDEYICSTYNLAKGNFEEKCSSHYIRNEVLNKLVLETIKEVSEYVKLNEEEFIKKVYSTSKEQMVLEKSIEHSKSILKNFEEDSIRADKFISLVKKYTDFSELTTPMINEFVDKILVHEDKWDNYERTQEVEIYLNFIGKFELPQEEPKELTQEELYELEKLRKKEREEERV